MNLLSAGIKIAGSSPSFGGDCVSYSSHLKDLRMIDYSALAESAVAAKELSLAPYSNFRVGAALIATDDTVYLGANIESASYSLTCCAERTALFKALLDRKRSFKAIAIASDSTTYCPPCGACRQVLADHCGKEFEVVLVHPNGNHKVYTLQELLPVNFEDTIMNKE